MTYLFVGQSQASIDAKHVQADMLYKEAIDKVGHSYGTVYMGSPHRDGQGQGQGQGPNANPGPLGSTSQGPPSSLLPSLLNLPGKTLRVFYSQLCTFIHFFLLLSHSSFFDGISHNHSFSLAFISSNLSLLGDSIRHFAQSRCLTVIFINKLFLYLSFYVVIVLMCFILLYFCP